LFRYTAEVLPFHDFDLDTALGELARMGYREVNLWASAAPLAHHVRPGDDPSQIKTLLDKHGLSACGLTMYGKSQEQILAGINWAPSVGIDTIVFDCEANYGDFVHDFLPPLVRAAERNNVRIAVENHLTVPFTPDFEHGVNEDRRWDEGVDTLDQIKRLIRDVKSPNLGVCLAPPHLWVMDEVIANAISFLAERKRLFYYYIWDIDPEYRHGQDGLNFGSGEKQLPRPEGTLDHAVLLGLLGSVGYSGPASLKCHGTHGWSMEKVTSQLAASDAYVRSCLDRAGLSIERVRPAVGGMQ
jgi:sugar phosphate isomerase/epimerase